MTTLRWGELPIIADTDSGIAAIEREQITKPRQLDLEGPLLHQPGIKDEPSLQGNPLKCSFGDSMISSTIALNQHAKKLRLMINSLQQQIDSKGTEDLQLQVSNAFSLLEPDNASVKPPLEFGSNESNFRKGIGEMPVEINEQIAKKLMRKSIGIMCAHVGYENTTGSVLDTLVDITHEYFLKLTRMLRVTVDQEALVGGTRFPDSLEHVFYEIGIGSIRNLGEFYKTNVLDYRNYLLETCRNLNEEYEKLRCPVACLGLDENIKIKQEPLSSIEFPISEEREDVSHNTEVNLPLEELHSTLEHESSNIAAVSVDEDHTKVGETCSRAPIASLESDDEIINIIDSPIQTNELELITREESFNVPVGDGRTSPTPNVKLKSKKK